MRRLPPRPPLPARTIRMLAAKAELIAREQDHQSAAERIYRSSREAKWFASLTKALCEMCGPGSRCMFCNGNEASNVEHFRPKSIFPLEAMAWENFLWVCSICNQWKGNRFPPDTEPGPSLINPTVEDAWEFFFVDEYGNLCPRWNIEQNCLDPRAVKTMDILKLDREAIQTSRQMRMDELKQRSHDTLERLLLGQLTINEVRERITIWKSQPYQPDIADYFFCGPGRSEEPFRELIARCQE